MGSTSLLVHTVVVLTAAALLAAAAEDDGDSMSRYVARVNHYYNTTEVFRRIAVEQATSTDDVWLPERLWLHLQRYTMPSADTFRQRKVLTDAYLGCPPQYILRDSSSSAVAAAFDVTETPNVTIFSWDESESLEIKLHLTNGTLVNRMVTLMLRDAVAKWIAAATDIHRNETDYRRNETDYHETDNFPECELLQRATPLIVEWSRGNLTDSTGRTVTSRFGDGTLSLDSSTGWFVFLDQLASLDGAFAVATERAASQRNVRELAGGVDESKAQDYDLRRQAPAPLYDVLFSGIGNYVAGIRADRLEDGWTNAPPSPPSRRPPARHVPDEDKLLLQRVMSAIEKWREITWPRLHDLSTAVLRETQWSKCLRRLGPKKARSCAGRSASIASRSGSRSVAITRRLGELAIDLRLTMDSMRSVLAERFAQ